MKRGNVRWGITDEKKECSEIDVWDEENMKVRIEMRDQLKDCRYRLR
jgi:hypothetical protein